MLTKEERIELFRATRKQQREARNQEKEEQGFKMRDEAHKDPEEKQ